MAAVSTRVPAKELVICGTMEPPLKFLDADQKLRGLDIDIITTIFDTLETPFRIELADSGAHRYRADAAGHLLHPAQGGGADGQGRLPAQPAQEQPPLQHLDPRQGRLAAYYAEPLRMKHNGSLKALYDKYGIPYIEP